MRDANNPNRACQSVLRSVAQSARPAFIRANGPQLNISNYSDAVQNRADVARILTDAIRNRTDAAHTLTKYGSHPERRGPEPAPIRSISGPTQSGLIRRQNSLRNMEEARCRRCSLRNNHFLNRETFTCRHKVDSL